MEALAPELLPMLVGIESPANFIPITNTLLAELQRRGVSRDQLLATLQQLGSEVPTDTLEMLKYCSAAKVDVKVLSDCNSVFISHILAGAKASGLVQDVITNPASFERASVAAGSSPVGLGSGPQPGACCSPGGLASLASTSHHKLVIQARHGAQCSAHGCTFCPENLCKGAEVRAIQQAGTYRTIIYAGDGANDICPALALGPGDWVLARQGHALARYIQEVGPSGKDGRPPVTANVRFWSCHDDLNRHVQQLVSRQ